MTLQHSEHIKAYFTEKKKKKIQNVVCQNVTKPANFRNRKDVNTQQWYHSYQPQLQKLLNA